MIVVAATNRPDILDAALLRPGTLLDRQVYVHPARHPWAGADPERAHAQGADWPGRQPRVIARGTPGMTGADLANLLQRSGPSWQRGATPAWSKMQDFERGPRTRLFMGPRAQEHGDARGRAAQHGLPHESGHALIGKMLPRVRSGPQGHHHSARAGPGVNHEACRRKTATATTASTCSTITVFISFKELFLALQDTPFFLFN